MLVVSWDKYWCKVEIINALTIFDIKMYESIIATIVEMIKLMTVNKHKIMFGKLALSTITGNLLVLDNNQLYHISYEWIDIQVCGSVCVVCVCVLPGQMYGCRYKNCLIYSICAVPQLVPHCGAIRRALSLF